MKSTLPAPEAIEARLAQLEALIDHAADGLVLLDVESCSYTHANTAAAGLLGTRRDELIREGPAALARRSAFALQDIHASCRQAVSRAPESFVEIRKYTRADGAPGWLELSQRAVQIAGRWAVVGTLRDVTERMTGRARQQYLQAAMNQSEESIVVIDPETLAYVDVNDGTANMAKRLWGRTRQECIERGPLGLREDMGLKPDPQVLRSRYAGVIARHPDTVTDVIRGIPPTGRPFALEASRRAVMIDGQWLILVVTRDISGRDAATQRQERLLAALNEVVDAIVVIDAENDKYVDVNEAAARLVGLSREELLQRGPLEYRSRMGLDEDVIGWQGRNRELMARHPLPSTEIYVGHPAARPPVVIEATRRAVNIDGKWLILAVHRDITERHAATQRLEMLKEAINEATDVVLVVDAQTLTYVHVNRATERVYGIPAETMIERGHLWTLEQLGISGRKEDEVRERYRELIAAHPRSSTILRDIRRPDGASATIEITRRALQVDGRWLILNVTRDVTERVRAEHELKQRMDELARSNRDLEQFAYVSSHDLSEPLRMVSSYIQLLDRRYARHFDADAREFMGYILDGAQRMKQLIDDLLVYSRAGRSGSELRELPLDRALDEALVNLGHVIREAGVAIVRPSLLPALPHNKTGMTQLFQNLIANAVKFRTGEAPSVRIDAARDGEDWIISVTDNGIGIEPQYYERIFEIFQRLHARTAYEGTGIGLAICKKIVERHGGTIWVESQPGLGTSFRFRLPSQGPLQS